MKYSDLSVHLTKIIEKNEKKNNGIFFTPPQTIHENIEHLKPFLNSKVKNVLEPSCGSCEYIIKLEKEFNNLSILGMEINKTIFNSIKNIKSKNKNSIKFLNQDFIKYEFNCKYDLIIGNPPFFVMKKNQVNKSYYNYFDGRPNIFILFIVKSLKLLNDNGILSFILPKSFLNCLYYDKTRKYINEHFKILKIIELNDNYIDTKQETIILIIQKSNVNDNIVNNNNYILKIPSFTIFGTPENIKKLGEFYNNSKTLNDLGFNVSVGNIVWNQCKKDLTNDKNKTLLVYSSDIKNNELVVQKYSNKLKKNYINKKGIKHPTLVINRGYGVGSYNFNYCIINEKESIEYLIENHLICIKYLKQIKNSQLIDLYKKIIESFKNKKTLEFIKLYFGNNAINTTELCNILPIYNINDIDL